MVVMRNFWLKISIAIISLLSLLTLSPVVVHAQCDPTTTKGSIACGTDNSAGVPGSGTPVKDLNTTITNIVDILSIVVGIVAVVMIIIAGFRYITSGGKQESVTGAKNTILYAVIGLVIVAFAQVIARFALNTATKK
jgi:hypothetical protein